MAHAATTRVTAPTEKVTATHVSATATATQVSTTAAPVTTAVMLGKSGRRHRQRGPQHARHKDAPITDAHD